MPIVKTQQKTVFSPFSTVFPADPNRDSLDEIRVAPFRGPPVPIRNGENGKND
jgi:hypothetical protein